MAEARATIAPLEIAPEQSFTAKDLRDFVADHYNNTKTLLKFKLLVPKDAATAQTELGKLLSNSANGQTITKAAYYLSQHPNDKTKEYTDLFLRFPVIPLPMVVSKLYTLFQPDHVSNSVVSSYTVLLHLQTLLPKVLELSTVAKQTKTSVAKQLHTTLEETILFSSNTLGRLQLFPYDEDLARTLLRETYYNMLNLVRIWEFSILDLLGFPHKFQTAMVCPIELNVDSWLDTYTLPEGLIQELWKEMHEQFVSTFKRTGKVSEPPASEPTTSWPSKTIQADLDALIKAALNNQLFLCSNTDHCKNKESRQGQFKRCTRCGWARYCSVACQTKHWADQHKLLCHKKLSAAKLTELFQGRRIIISSEADEAVAKDHEVLGK